MIALGRTDVMAVTSEKGIALLSEEEGEKGVSSHLNEAAIDLHESESAWKVTKVLVQGRK